MADPIDYDARQAAIVTALRKAQQLQQAETPAVQYKQFGDIQTVLAPGGLSRVATAIDRGLGDFQERQAQKQQSELDTSQMRELADYQKQLAAVPTQTNKVLTKTMAANGMPQFVEEEVALTPEEQNAKRTDIAIGMSRLPRARQMANELFKQTIEFPERRAEQLEKLAAQKDMQSERLKQQAQLAGDNLELRRQMLASADAARADALALRTMLGQMSNNIAQQNADTNAARLAEQKRQNDLKEGERAEKAQLKAQDAAVADTEAKDSALHTIELIDKAIGKRDPATGKLLPGQKEHKNLRDYVGVYFGETRAKIPGSGAADYKTLDEQIRANARLTGVHSLKGTGSVSNAEGQAAADALDAAQQSNTVEAYTEHMLDYRRVLEKAADRQARGVKVTPDGKEYKPTAGSAASDDTYQGQTVKRRVQLKNGNIGIELESGDRIEIPAGGQ